MAGEEGVATALLKRGTLKDGLGWIVGGRAGLTALSRAGELCDEYDRAEEVQHRHAPKPCADKIPVDGLAMLTALVAETQQTSVPPAAMKCGRPQLVPWPVGVLVPVTGLDCRAVLLCQRETYGVARVAGSC